MSSDGAPWSSMTVIERVRFIHRRFLENNEKRSYDFKIEMATELQMPGFGKRSDNAVITAFDNYYQLAYRTGSVWQLVNKILSMWINGQVNGQKKDTNYDTGMKLTQWQRMQGIRDDTIIIPVLQKVIRKRISLKEMGEEFTQYKLVCTVQQAFVTALGEKTWSTCKARYPEHATDDAVKRFAPVFHGWRDPTKKKRAFTSVLTELPDLFNSHIREAQAWSEKRGDKLCSTAI